MKDIYNNNEYLNNNESWHEEDSPYKTSFCIDILKKNNIQFSTVADVGCGAGLVAELFSKQYPNVKVTGYDFSVDASKKWENRKTNTNFNLVNNNYDENSEDVDCVLCLDVFEHVDDYLGFLRSLGNKSKYFVFNIPLDMSVMKLIYGLRFAREEVGHIHYFNTYTALETLKDTGYEIMNYKHSIAFLKVPPRNIRQILILPFRLLTLLFGFNFASLIFGGISLVVLAKKSKPKNA
jgi:SAM-dependent methyltransferase